MSRQQNAILVTVILSLFIFHTLNVSINSGKVLLAVKSVSGQQQKLKIDIKSTSKTQLKLTQSSKIELEATVQFSSPSFIPEFFAFRLRNQQFEGATEPVLAIYSDTDQKYKATIDLGNPEHIKAISGNYQLEVIISDDLLTENLRSNIANCNIAFRNAISSIPQSALQYSTLKLIETNAPATRIDPPQTFTGFVVLLLIAQFGIFIYGLSYLKANVKLFPSSFMGMAWNLGFLTILMGVLAVLFKFWIDWTFITTVQYLSIIILPMMIVSNYALMHIKKN